MFLIEKTFSFDAAHNLVGLPDGHKCGNLHGHTYSVTLRLLGDELDQCGFLVDYASMRTLREYIDLNLDHAYLNDVLSFNPTAENLAQFLYKVAKQIYVDSPTVLIHSVTVSETPATKATYSE